MYNTKIPSCWIILFSAFAIMFCRSTYGARPLFELNLDGKASGGTLILADTHNRTVNYVCISTKAGESGESVVERLAAEVNSQNSSESAHAPGYYRHRLWQGGFQATTKGSILMLPGGLGNYMLAGTEKGLGIPSPPLDVSCSFNMKQDSVEVRWTNPQVYDLILVKMFWEHHDRTHVARLPGTSSSYEVDRKEVPVGKYDLSVRILGVVKNVPSNAGAVHVEGRCQSELYGLPFSQGIPPNWVAWSTSAGGLDEDSMTEKEKYPGAKVYNPTGSLLTKPSYLVLRAPKKGSGIHGISRRFLGLNPGHTYRLTACASTLKMESRDNSRWSLDVVVTYGDRSDDQSAVERAMRRSVTPETEEDNGPKRIVSYGSGRKASNAFEMVVGGNIEEHENGLFTLPSDVDSITVWVGFMCDDPQGEVGFSGVSLEDVTTHSRRAAEIVREARREEIVLLKSIEKSFGAPPIEVEK